MFDYPQVQCGRCNNPRSCYDHFYTRKSEDSCPNWIYFGNYLEEGANQCDNIIQELKQQKGNYEEQLKQLKKEKAPEFEITEVKNKYKEVKEKLKLKTKEQEDINKAIKSYNLYEESIRKKTNYQSNELNIFFNEF